MCLVCAHDERVERECGSYGGKAEAEIGGGMATSVEHSVVTVIDKLE